MSSSAASVSWRVFSIPPAAVLYDTAAAAPLKNPCRETRNNNITIETENVHPRVCHVLFCQNNALLRSAASADSETKNKNSCASFYLLFRADIVVFRATTDRRVVILFTNDTAIPRYSTTVVVTHNVLLIWLNNLLWWFCTFWKHPPITWINNSIETALFVVRLYYTI